MLMLRLELRYLAPSVPPPIAPFPKEELKLWTLSLPLDDFLLPSFWLPRYCWWFSDDPNPYSSRTCWWMLDCWDWLPPAPFLVPFPFPTPTGFAIPIRYDCSISCWMSNALALFCADASWRWFLFPPFPLPWPAIGAAADSEYSELEVESIVLWDEVGLLGFGLLEAGLRVEAIGVLWPW